MNVDMSSFYCWFFHVQKVVSQTFVFIIIVNDNTVLSSKSQLALNIVQFVFYPKMGACTLISIQYLKTFIENLHKINLILREIIKSFVCIDVCFYENIYVEVKLSAHFFAEGFQRTYNFFIFFYYNYFE